MSSVCVPVCLSASISPERHARSSPDFWCVHVYLAVVRSSTGGVTVRCVLAGFMDDVVFAYGAYDVCVM